MNVLPTFTAENRQPTFTAENWQAMLRTQMPQHGWREFQWEAGAFRQKAGPIFYPLSDPTFKVGFLARFDHLIPENSAMHCQFVKNKESFALGATFARFDMAALLSNLLSAVQDVDTDMLKTKMSIDEPEPRD